jgi:protein-L-isoaspartate(D-aspartate) O-methyltransferase
MANMRFPQDIFYGIKDQRIIEVINSIPREDFLPESLRDYAYADTALPIGSGQTISQPSLVAYMTQLLELTGRERVLEIGTGSGYQTAILAGLVQEVYTCYMVDIGTEDKLLLQGFPAGGFKPYIGPGCFRAVYGFTLGSDNTIFPADIVKP